MPPKILRRCTVCKQFHASYLVEDPNRGKIYLCYDCWKARQAASASTEPLPGAISPPQETGQKTKRPI